jgi:hypothetical protein
MKLFFNWLAEKISPQKASAKPSVKKAGRQKFPKKAPVKQAVPRSQPEYVEFDSSVDGQIDDAGPGKSILKRNRSIRDETETHDKLSILGEPDENQTDEEGIDPYNTGQFDRSKHWDKRFRKD